MKIRAKSLILHSNKGNNKILFVNYCLRYEDNIRFVQRFFIRVRYILCRNFGILCIFLFKQVRLWIFVLEEWQPMRQCEECRYAFRNKKDGNLYCRKNQMIQCVFEDGVQKLLQAVNGNAIMYQKWERKVYHPIDQI